jgi:hypothetical protein
MSLAVYDNTYLWASIRNLNNVFQRMVAFISRTTFHRPLGSTAEVSTINDEPVTPVRVRIICRMPWL